MSRKLADYVEERDKILKWLTPIDYALQQNTCDRSRPSETGTWFLESTEFKAWLATKGQTLFCPGIPGAGKTFITSIVIDHILKKVRNQGDVQCRKSEVDNTVGIAYLYCMFNRPDEQNLENLLLILLRQLVQQRPSLPSFITELYEARIDIQMCLTHDEILKALHSTIALYSKVFIVVDALDECQVQNGCRSKFLSSLFKLRDECGVSLFATSRSIPEIEDKFKRAVSLEIRGNEEDLHIFLEEKIRDSIDCSPELKEHIKRGIIQAVEGM